MSQRPGTMLSHYRIVEKIGEGGMGVVYKAWDEKLRRSTAIKTLRDNLMINEMLRLRFLREARAAAAVNHPNIATIYEADEAEGVAFIAMELVEGEMLRSYLQGRPLPIADAVSLATEIAEGLSGAHIAHVVHRDLKPENVIIGPERQVKILDFGLAKLVDESGDADRPPGSQVETRSVSLTRERRVVGTTAYMSPEQARSQPVDSRSDLFSFGATLYEMVTGRAAFRGSTHADTLSAVIRDTPPPPSELNSEVPHELERIIFQCLEKDPKDRYQDTRDLVVELRKLRRSTESGEMSDQRPERKPRRSVRRIVAVAAGVLAMVAVWRFGPWWSGGEDRSPQPTDSKVETPKPPSSPAFTFYERGIHYLEQLELARSFDDAIQMFNRGVRIDPDFAPAWAALGEAYWIRYQSKRDDSSREEATKAVEEAFRLDPSLAEAFAARGRGFMAEGNYSAAKEALKEAVARRADFDRAWSYLGIVHQNLEEYAEGLEALQKATQLRPGQARYLIWLGLFFYHFSEFDAAATTYRKALALKPDSRMAWNNLGNSYLQLGKPAEAVPAYLRSLEVEENADARTNLGTAYYFLGKYKEAEPQYRRATELETNDAVYWANLGDVLKMLSRDEESRAAYLEAVALARNRVEVRPLDPFAHMNLGLYCARAGEADCALREGRRAAEMQPQSAEITFRFAIGLCLVGREDEALDQLEKAVKLGLSRSQIENDPDLQILSGHQRYKRILDLAG